MTTVAELVIQEAMARGNHYIFGIPGGGPGLTMISAASRAGCGFVLVNNEATGAMAASAYGQFVGTPGVCFSIQGTGGGNLVGGIVASYLERGPVLAITDRYPDELLGRVHIQDAHLARVLAPIVKGSMTLQPASARRTLHSAFELAWAERPGPVHLDFPADVADVPISETESVIRPAIAISQASVSGDVVAAAKALEDAKRVVVIVGTDALRARAGKEILHLPYSIEPENVSVNYTEFEGWGEDLTSITNAADLPGNMKDYIRFIEDFVGVRVSLVSVGPDRNQTIHVE